MSLAEIVLRSTNVLTASMVAGGQVTVLWVIVPVKRRFETPFAVRLHQAMLGRQIDRFMRPFGISSFVAGGLVLALDASKTFVRTPASLVLMGLGLLGTIGVAITSRGFNVPTNRTIDRWTPETIPSGYQTIRDRWDRIHAIRSFCGVFALTSYLLSAMLR
jgi:hypothetical protein